MNNARKNKKCNCLDDEPGKCYELRLLKTGKKLEAGNTQYFCSCSCHAKHMEANTDQVKGGC